MSISRRPRLHVVTGKGGTGKTTVAAALALALADGGRKVLLVEVEERQGIASVLDTPPLTTREDRIATASGGGQVMGLEVQARQALMEYLRSAYRLGPAGAVLERIGAVDFATTIAPGVRDVLLVGKVFEAVRRRQGERPGLGAGLRRGERRNPEPAYDHVVLDAPPTGRIGRFLDVTTAVADLAKVGPIHSHASKITTLLHSPDTVVHLVTLLEQMPVQETLDAAAELADLGLAVGSVVANHVHASPLRALPEEEALVAQLRAGGLRVTGDLPDALLAQGRHALERTALQDEQREALLALERPVLELPRLEQAVGREAVGTLAWELAAHLDEPDSLTEAGA